MTTKHEAAQARRWRESLGLTRARLSELTGYSPLSIQWFELGRTPPGRGKTANDHKIKDHIWRRYKLTCAAVHVSLLSGRDFRWGE